MAKNEKISDRDRIVRGSLDNLPPNTSNVIRIFLSSTFTDYAEERNRLMRDAIPRLRSYCRNEGVELEIADMRWGVRDEAQIDHKASELCIQEIKKCREQSMGPYFVAFLGNRYGGRHYPSVIDGAEFSLLLRAARTAYKDTSLIEEWYVRDDNSLPSVYVLQPITAKYPHYNDESDENEHLRKKDREEWTAVNNLLAHLFRVASNYAFKYRKMSAAQKHKYHMSITEEEVTEGILTQRDENRTLCFFRTIEQIEISNALAWRFIDLDGSLPNQEPLELLKTLKSVSVPRAMKNYNTDSFTVKWQPKGIEPENEEHGTYLEDFNDKFYRKVLRQIDEAMKSKSKREHSQIQFVYEEALHHAHFAQEKCRNFCGRRELLKQIQQKLCQVFEPDIIEEEVLVEDESKKIPKKEKMKKEQETDMDDDDDEDVDDDDEKVNEESKPIGEVAHISPDGLHENLLDKVIEEVDEEALAADENASQTKEDFMKEKTIVSDELQTMKKERKDRRRKIKELRDEIDALDTSEAEAEQTEQDRKKRKVLKKRLKKQKKALESSDSDVSDSELPSELRIRLQQNEEQKEAKKKRKKEKKAKKNSSESDDDLTEEQQQDKKKRKKEKKQKLKEYHEKLLDIGYTSNGEDDQLEEPQLRERKEKRKARKKLKKALRKEYQMTDTSSESDNEGPNISDAIKKELEDLKQNKVIRKTAKKKAKDENLPFDSDNELNKEQKEENKKKQKQRKTKRKELEEIIKVLDSTSESSDVELTESQKLKRKVKRKVRKEQRKAAKKRLKELKSSFSSDSSDQESTEKEKKKKQKKWEKKKIKQLNRKENKQKKKEIKAKIKTLDSTSDSEDADKELTEDQRAEKKAARKERKLQRKMAKIELQCLETTDSEESSKEEEKEWLKQQRKKQKKMRRAAKSGRSHCEMKKQRKKTKKMLKRAKKDSKLQQSGINTDVIQVIPQFVSLAPSKLRNIRRERKEAAGAEMTDEQRDQKKKVRREKKQRRKEIKRQLEALGSSSDSEVEDAIGKKESRKKHSEKKAAKKELKRLESSSDSNYSDIEFTGIEMDEMENLWLKLGDNVQARIQEIRRRRSKKVSEKKWRKNKRKELKEAMTSLDSTSDSDEVDNELSEDQKETIMEERFRSILRKTIWLEMKSIESSSDSDGDDKKKRNKKWSVRTAKKMARSLSEGRGGSYYFESGNKYISSSGSESSSSSSDSSSDSDCSSASSKSVHDTSRSDKSSPSPVEKRKQQQREMSENKKLANYMKDMNVNFAMEADELNLNQARQQELEVPELTTYTKPLFVCGASGAGKTALLAKVAKVAEGWFDKDINRIVRFLGTSPGTSSLRHTLMGVCAQICSTYDHSTIITSHDLEKDFSLLSAYFFALLSKIDTEKQPLLIVLDSLDQLSADDYVFTMNWLECRLPPGVLMVISVLPDHMGALDNARRILSHDRFLEVTPLPKDTAGELIDMWFAEIQRTITAQQREVLMTAFKTCPQPLFLQIAFENAKTWRSYMAPEEINVGVSIRSAIEMLFTRLETSHGAILVAKAFGYLTVSKNGLSSPEMEDVLSLDDEVLQDTYLYHLPPDSKQIRLPPLLWRRVIYDIEPYLTTRRADGKNLVTWYHRQFAEVATNRYCKDPKPLHALLADYFSGKYANVPKALELYKKKKGYYSEAMRGAPEQPIKYPNGGYNLRKMSELPHHLVACQEFVRFTEEVSHNLEFLIYKSSTSSVTAVLKDLNQATDILKTFTELPKLPRKQRPNLVRQETTFLTKENTQMVANLEQDEAFEEGQLEDSEEDSADLEGSEAGSVGQECGIDSIKEEVRLVHDMILLGMDAISKDFNNLPIQIVGQLGPSVHPHAGLELLRRAACDYMASSRTPLLVPETQCLPGVGGALLGTTDVPLAFPGDDPGQECKLALTADGHILYAVHRVDIHTDVLKVYDLMNKNAPMRQEKLQDQSVRRIQLLANDRYLLLEVYTDRDEFSPKYRAVLSERESRVPVNLPSGYRLLTVSESGTYAVLANGEQESSPGPWPETGQSSETRLEIVGALFRFSDSTLTPLKVQVKGPRIPNMTCGVVSADDKHVFVCCSDKRRYILTTDKGRLKHGFGDFDTYYGRNKELVTFVDNSTVIAKADKHIEIISVEKGKVNHVLEGHQYYRYGLMCLNNDRSLVAAATTDSGIMNGDREKYVSVWDVAGGALVSQIKEIGPYNAITFLGKEYLLVAPMGRPLAKVWYVGTPASPCVDAIPVYTILGHTSDLYNLIVTPDMSMLITGSMDNTLRFWSLETILAECNARVEAVSTDISALQRLMEVPDRPYEPGEGMISTTAITVSRDGQTAAVGTHDGWLMFYDLRTAERIRHENVGGPVTSLLTSRSGEYIVSAAADVRVWDPKTGECVRTIECKYRPACMAEAQNILVVGQGGMEAYGHLYHLNTGEKFRSLQGLYGFSQVVISSDAKKVITTFFDYPLIFNTDSDDPVKFEEPDTMMYGSTCLRLSADDKYIASCSSDGSVRVMALEGAKYMYRMQHKSSVREATFTNNASLLLTAGFRSILVWSMADGSLAYTLSRHQNFINHLRPVCGSRYLVSCSDDKQIVLWDLATKSSVASFYAHCPVRCMAVADDLSSVMYSPEGVNYLGVLKPNRILSEIVRGRAANRVSAPVQTAQAYAFAFSNQPVVTSSSKACSIM